MVFFTQAFLKEKQLFRTKFLFYSILSFYFWARFIIEHNFYLWFVLEKNEPIILQLLNRQNIGFIHEITWIPGIVSNTIEIKQGKRYLFSRKEKTINTPKLADFIFFCSTKQTIALQETNNQLIPQFALILNINHALSKYFIPLFVFKSKKQIYKLNKAHINTFFNDIAEYNEMPTMLKLKKVSIFRDYIEKSHAIKINNYLIYLFLLGIIIG
jgi:hypothetical protein